MHRSEKNEERKFIAIDTENLDELIEQINDLPSLNKLADYQDYLKREIYVGVVDDSLIDGAAYLIKKYNEEDDKRNLSYGERQPIKIFINSDGGLVYPCMHVVDLIESSRTPVHTICQSRALSAGGMLLMAGHKRFAYPSSIFLLHSGSSGAYGDTNQVRDTVKFYEKFMDSKMNTYLYKRTNITPEMHEQHKREEWYMMANEMLDLGLIDEITNSLNFDNQSKRKTV